MDASISKVFAGSVVEALCSTFREIVLYVLFPLIDLIFFHTFVVGVDGLRDETYLNHDCFLLFLMIFRDNALYFLKSMRFS